MKTTVAGIDKLTPEERAMRIWCEADLAIAGGNVVVHRERIAEAIRDARRETIEECAKVAEASERKRWEIQGNPMIPTFTPYIANSIRALGKDEVET